MISYDLNHSLSVVIIFSNFILYLSDDWGVWNHNFIFIK